MITLGSGPEFDRIRDIARVLGQNAEGLGDDCAFVTLGSTILALSTDVSVEDVHFRRAWLTNREIGWRAAAAALSDLAAVGASPIGVLVAVTVPPELSATALSDIMGGVGDCVGGLGGKVLGGDLSKGAILTVAVTVVGEARAPVRRAGAEPGDGVWVTGALGGARAALLEWSAGREPGNEIRAAFAHPSPRLAEGRWLAAHGATAMLDLSDGLAGDAAHLAAASGIALEIQVESLPIVAGVVEVAAFHQQDAAVMAAEGGEDYELLVTLPSGFVAPSPPELGFSLTRLGTVRAGAGVRFLKMGRPIVLSSHDHFA